MPQEIRAAVGATPRQCLVWEIRKDGSAVVRLVRSVMELAGSLKLEVPFSSIGEETEAATAAWVSGAAKPNSR